MKITKAYKLIEKSVKFHIQQNYEFSANTYETKTYQTKETKRIYEKREELKEALEIMQQLSKLVEEVINSPIEMQEIMRKNNLKIDNLDDSMQKLAFTFYTRIVSLSSKAEHILED